MTVFITNTIDLYRINILSIHYNPYALHRTDRCLPIYIIQDPFLHMFCHTPSLSSITMSPLDDSYTVTIGVGNYWWTHFKVLGEIGRRTSGLGHG